MSTNTLLDAENAVEDIGLKALLRFICTTIEGSVPFLALPIIRPTFEFIVFTIGRKIGHQGIREIGNKIIDITTAHDAAVATDEGKKLKEVLANPAAKPEEIKNANKSFDDAYSKLIHFSH